MDPSWEGGGAAGLSKMQESILEHAKKDAKKGHLTKRNGCNTQEVTLLTIQKCPAAA